MIVGLVLLKLDDRWTDSQDLLQHLLRP